MTEKPPASPWPKRVLIGAVIASPLLLQIPVLVRGGRARAQDDVPKGEARRPNVPGEATLTPAQEKALELRIATATRRTGDHPLVAGGKVSLDLEHTARLRPLLNSTIHEARKHA